MFTHVPVSSDGFILSLIDVLLLFCKPYASKFNDYRNSFSKLSLFYMINDNYVAGASKLEKLD